MMLAGKTNREIHLGLAQHGLDYKSTRTVVSDLEAYFARSLVPTPDDSQWGEFIGDVVGQFAQGALEAFLQG